MNSERILNNRSRIVENVLHEKHRVELKWGQQKLVQLPLEY